MARHRTAEQLRAFREQRAALFAKRKAAYNVTCPKCNRGPGLQCLSKTYKITNTPHTERVKLGLESEQ